MSRFFRVLGAPVRDLLLSWTPRLCLLAAAAAAPTLLSAFYALGVSREAFAVFMQPEWGESMDVPM